MKSRKRAFAAVAVAIVVVAVALGVRFGLVGHKGHNRNAMSMGAIQDHSAKSPAEALFVEKCGMCHRQMGMGTVLLSRRIPAGQAMLEQRNDLTRAYIESAVRGGIGNMPRITRGEVSDQQLGIIAGYLAKGARP